MSTQAFKPSRVVMLGARGFIASTLHKQLVSNSIEVLALGSLQLDLLSSNASYALAHHLRPDDAVVMLSAITPDKGRDTAAFMNNLTMMQNVCIALKQRPVSHLIYLSSDAVYGLKDGVISETSSPSPTNFYGAMHLSRELMVHSTGISAAILRLTMVYGSEDTHLAYGPNRFILTAAKDQKITLFGNGEELRDHIHVDDVAAIVLRCVCKKYTGLLNIATGKSTAFIDVAKLIASHFSGVELVRIKRENQITNRKYDVTKLIKEFPEFRFISLKTGLTNLQKNYQSTRKNA